MIRRPPRSTPKPSSAASDVYKRQVLYEMYKSGTPFEELIVKGNTVPKGKRPVFGMEAVMNMRKKFK